MDTMDYSKEILKIKKNLEGGQHKAAAKICAFVLEKALKDIYARIKVYAPPGYLKQLLAIEEKTTQDSFQNLPLIEMANVFREGEILKNMGPVCGAEVKLMSDSQLYGLVDVVNKCTETGYIPTADQLDFIYFNLKAFLKESGLFKDSVCPNCGETIEDDWEFCPSCESLLKPLTCPHCNEPIKEKWKRCPSCGTRLVCQSCNNRIPRGHSSCPVCDTGNGSTAAPKSDFTDPITGMEFVYIKGGAFMMGDVSGEGSETEIPVHEVNLKSFFIGKYPVTQTQWQRVMENNPSRFQGDFRPVEQVSWFDVRIFIKRLSEMNKGKYEYRLPSEAEWEYAARSSGKDEKFAGGDRVNTVAWFEENSDGSTHPVGKKEPNGLGLYDMSGNVWEWCLDVYREDAYKNHIRENPVCTEGGSDRVIRGGSWNLDAWSVRCARRFSCTPDFFGPGLGFRLVRVR